MLFAARSLSPPPSSESELVWDGERTRKKTDRSFGKWAFINHRFGHIIRKSSRAIFQISPPGRDVRLKNGQLECDETIFSSFLSGKKSGSKSGKRTRTRWNYLTREWKREIEIDVVEIVFEHFRTLGEEKRKKKVEKTHEKNAKLVRVERKEAEIRISKECGGKAGTKASGVYVEKEQNRGAKRVVELCGVFRILKWS